MADRAAAFDADDALAEQVARQLIGGHLRVLEADDAGPLVGAARGGDLGAESLQLLAQQVRHHQDCLLDLRRPRLQEQLRRRPHGIVHKQA